MSDGKITMRDILGQMYTGDVGPEKFIVDRWMKRRVWWKRVLGFAVRRWRFNEHFVKTADGKVHKTGPI